ncbi:copper chaperone PCu(A)C [Reinekea marinisedimentorum]|uniref:Copper(I)-binding protein n=1 Tax=Reinekea marinisedimentorum TaxID=230495 RepID=A0A4R3IDA7_9GAMM|nr:copper chaperone PCu(A)C [Reinekea marinisedimentorum]TCS43746.1 hypothetical protein BCF53_10189 [Reinekea marinisedimentorum]
MKILLKYWLLLISMALSVTAFADAVSQIEIHQPWARVSPPGAPSAGFMLVQNHGSSDDVLLSVSGDFAARLELHLSHMEDGVMKMTEQKEGIVIPAGGEVLFKPGSYHLMFMGLAKPFVAGEVYRVTLQFEQAGSVELALPVQEMTDMPAMKH